MDNYIDDMSKMALALTSAQLAKDEAIKEHGVGEELAVHFLAWSDDALVAICQMNADTSLLSPDERFEKCKQICSIMRRFYWSTAITMVSEGYCSIDADATKNMDLASAFVDPRYPVYECVTVNHTSINEEGAVSPVSMVAAPFTLHMGRRVDWRETLVYPERADTYVKQSKYPAMLRKSLMEVPTDEITQEIVDAVHKEIEKIGFLIQEIS